MNFRSDGTKHALNLFVVDFYDSSCGRVLAAAAAPNTPIVLHILGAFGRAPAGSGSHTVAQL